MKGNTTKISTNENKITALEEGWKLQATASDGKVNSSTEAAVKASNKVEIDTGKNIELTQADKKITIATSMTPEFTSVNATDNVTVGGTDGVKITNKKIENLDTDSIKGDKDAVNVAYLKDYVKKNTADGTMSSFNVADKTTTAKIENTETVKFVDGDGTVAQVTDNGEKNGANVQVDLSEQTKKDIKEGKDAKDAVDNKGLTFVGNDGESKVKKLGDKVDVKGTSNITTKGVDGGIEIALKNALDLTDAGSVKTGATTINNTGVTTPKVTTGETYMETGKVMNLEKRKPGDAEYGTGANEGRAATEGAVKAVDDKVTTNTGDISKLKNGWKLNTAADGGTASGSAETAVKTDEVVTVKAGKNIVITQAGRNITIATSDTPEFTSGTVKNELPAGDTYVKQGDKHIVNGGDVYNAIQNTETQYTGDNSAVTVKRKPSEVLAITGGATEGTTGNIKTEANASGSIAVQLAKNIKMTDGSINFVNSTGDEVDLNGDGLTITPKASSADKTPVTLTKDGLSNGGNQIHKVAEGTADDDAVNVKQLNAKISGSAYSWTVADKDNEKAVASGKKVTFKGADDSINVVRTDDGTEGNQLITVGLSNDVKVGKDGQPGKIGVAGENGKPGVAIDGKDGGTIVVGGADGKAGKDGVDGKPGVAINGKDGSIGLSGKDGKSTITVAPGKPGLDGIGKDGVDGANGKTETRIVYTNKEGNPEEVANLNDGLMFQGNNTDKAVIKKKLNTVMDVVGGYAIDNGSTPEETKKTIDEKTTAANNYVENDGSKLVIRMAKDLTDLNSATFKPADPADGKPSTVINNNGVTITPTADGKKPVSLTETGLNNGDNKITNVAEGKADTDAVNVKQLKDKIAEGAYSFTVSADGKDKKAVAKGKDVAFKGADKGGIVVTRSGADNEDQTFEFKLDKDVTVGDDTNPGTITVKGENGKDGTTITKDAIVFNGVDGVNGKDGADGKDGQASIKVEKGAKGLDGNDGKDGESKTRIVYEKPNGEKEQVATLNDGLKFKGNGDKTVDKKLNDTVTIKGGMTDLDDDKATAKNTRVDVDNDGNLVVKLAKNLEDLDKVVVGAEPGKDGNDGKPGIALDGKNGTIGITGPAGEDGAPGVSTTITVKDGQPGVDGKNGKDGKNPRLVVGDKEVATLDDGIKYVGDFKTASAVKLNKETTLTGEVGSKAKDAFTTGNIAVVADDENSTDSAKLTLKLAKDLTDLTSVTTTDKDGNTTVQNGSGVTITPDASKDENKDKKPVSLTKDGLNNGGNQITNVKSGGDINDDKNANNAANIGDLKKAAAASKTTVTSEDKSVTVTPKVETDGHTNYDLAVNNQKVVENAQVPVVYTDAKGNKVYKQDDGSFNTKADGTGDKVEKGNVIASMNDGSNNTAPTQLANVKSAIDGQEGDDFAKKLEAAAKDPIGQNSAVNVKDLKQATDGVTSAIVAKGLEFAGNTGKFHRDLGQTVTIKGEGTLDDNKYAGNNIKTIADDQGNITIKMAKDLKVDNVDVKDNVIVGPKGDDGTPGEGAVVIGKDGKDGANGISIKGKDGKDAVAINGKDGVGTIGLTGEKGKDGKPAEAIIGVKDGAKGLDGNDGKDGESKTRIVYTKPDGKQEEVATLNDGLKYTGDVGDAKVKLNQITNITGGVKDKDKLSDNNIGVVAEQAGENANLTIKLAKNLSGLDNVVFGDAKDDGTANDPKNTVSIGKDGVNAGGKQITNVKSGLDGKKLSELKDNSPELTNAANIGDLKNAVSNVTDSTKGGGFGLKDQDGKEIKQNLGTTVQVIGDNGIETKVVPVDPKKPDGAKALQVGLSNNVTIGDDKKPGTVTVKGENGKDGVAINGKDGGSIVVGGKDGKIGVDGKDGAPGIALNGKDGSIGVAGQDGANADITTSKGDAFLGGKGDDGKDGKNGTRITYQPKDKDGNPIKDADGKPVVKQVATMDDGIAYKGDTGEANVKLNKVTNIVGGVKDADKLADGNIGVVAEQDGDNAKLTVKLAKDLKGLNTVTLGDGKPGKDGKSEASTTIGKDGITIKGPKGKDGEDGKVVKLTDKGLDNGGNKITGVEDGNIAPGSKDAVNGGQLADVKKIAENAGSWDISVNGKNKSTVKPKSTVDFGSADGSIGVRKSVKDGVTKVDLALGNDVNIGGPGKDGKDGADGKLGVNGKDGKTGVAIDGANGTIGLTGPAGQDGKNPNAVIGVKDGAPGLDGNDGKDGASKTRVVYTKPDGKVEEVATLNDGVKYEGDQGKAAVKLNQTTKVVGGAKGELTDGNIGVVASQDGKNAKLTVKLAKDLKGINSVEAKDVTVKQGGNLKVERGANVDMGGNQVKNIASGISGKSYRNPKDNNAANIGDVKAIANQAVAPLNKRINDVDKHASAGTASAMAAAGLPQAYLPGHSMVAVGAGTHRGQNAIAVGVSRISDSGHVVIKLNGATNSKGDTSGSVGVGYQW